VKVKKSFCQRCSVFVLCSYLKQPVSQSLWFPPFAVERKDEVSSSAAPPLGFETLSTSVSELGSGGARKRLLSFSRCWIMGVRGMSREKEGSGAVWDWGSGSA